MLGLITLCVLFADSVEIFLIISYLRFILPGICNVASLHPHSDCSLRSVVLAQQLHLQQTGGTGSHSAENWTKVSQEKRNEIRLAYFAFLVLFSLHLDINYITRFIIIILCQLKPKYPPGRVSMMIVLVYLLCHSPKLILTFCEIMFKDPKVSTK